MDFQSESSNDGLGYHLPHIVRENELQKTIADERMRAEQHKSNYQTLKLDYLRLQQDFAALQKTMVATLEETNLIREKDKSLLEQARQDIIKKIKEIEMLKTQVLDPQKIKLIQLQVEGEMEKPYKEKLKLIEIESDAVRAEYNKLKTQHIFLKSEYENDRKQCLSMMEENKIKHEAEVSSLRKDRESKLSHYYEDSVQDFKQLKDLEHENTRLLVKVRSLENELDEMRNQKNYSGLKIESVTKVNSKVVTEYQSTIKAYEAERQMMKSQIENLHRELRLTTEEKNNSTIQKLDMEKQTASLKNKIEEMEHKLKKDVYEIRLEMLRERGKIEEERNSLQALYEDARAELEMLQEAIGKLENSLVEKEREAARKVQLAKEGYWHSFHALETEKIQIETKLKEVERRNMDYETEKSQLVEKLETRICVADEAKENLEKEVNNLRNRLVNQQILLDQLERDKLENSILKHRLTHMESKFLTFAEGEKEVLDRNDKLERQIGVLEKDLQSAKLETLTSREMFENKSSNKISSMAEEKCRLLSRIDELESHLRFSQKKLTSSAQTYQQKKMKLKKLLEKYRERIYATQLKQVDTDAKPESQGGDTGLLKSKLKDLLRKNQEFWNLLASTHLQQKVIGGLPFASVSYDFMPHSNGNVDWDQLKCKMDDMDEKLKLQLEEIKGKPSLETELLTVF